MSAGILGLFLLSFTILCFAPQPAQAEALFDRDRLSVHGWLRFYGSMNLNDPNDKVMTGTREVNPTTGATCFACALTGVSPNDVRDQQGRDDRYKLSMARLSAYLEVDLDFDRWGRYNLKVRKDEEMSTDYIDFLEGPTNKGLPPADLRELYTDDSENIREFYGEWELTQGVKLRLGKQQVVWGKTDFFQAMDIWHGFDWTWRSFLENEPDQLRKPLTLARLNWKVPDWGGQWEFIWYPGLDDGNSMAKDFGIRGGRWAGPRVRGVNFRYFTPYTWDNGDPHPSSDPDDQLFGLRWTGFFAPTGTEYAFSFAQTRRRIPILNTWLNSYQGVLSTDNRNSEWIFPEHDMYGVNFNHYLPGVPFMGDMVMRGEFAYMNDMVYNVGNDPREDCPEMTHTTAAGAMAHNTQATAEDFNRLEARTSAVSDPFGLVSGNLNPFGTPFFAASGVCGTVEKDTLRFMLGFDWPNVSWTEDWLWTDRSSFATLQIFDDWIINHNDNEDVVFFATRGKQSEHSVLATLVFNMHYAADTINPGLAIGQDLSYGGGFAIPSVDFKYGNNWRLRVEGNFFWEENGEGSRQSSFPIGDSWTPTSGPHAGTAHPFVSSRNTFPGAGTHLFSGFDGLNQLYMRLTYQF